MTDIEDLGIYYGGLLFVLGFRQSTCRLVTKLQLQNQLCATALDLNCMVLTTSDVLT